MIQWHTDSLNNPTPEEKAYEEYVWSRRGYSKPDEFWELPRWAGEVSHVLKENNQPFSFEVLTEPERLPWGETVIGSVLDVNLALWKEFINLNPDTTFLLGGYTKEHFNHYPNVFWFNTIEDFSAYEDLTYHKGVNWDAFEGYKCIPRLQLSQGCKHRCKFCSIDNRVTTNSISEIAQEVKSYKPLDFKLVYIDDKTFGQANNYRLLPLLGKEIRKYNPKFIGFIVQTTAAMVAKIDWKELDVSVAEVGVESYNDPILREMRKPATEKLIKQSAEILEEAGVRFVPNLIVGFTQENEASYKRTMEFLNETNWSHLNVYNLALYDEAELTSSFAETTRADANETETKKSFNSQCKNELNEEYYKLFLKTMNDE